MIFWGNYNAKFLVKLNMIAHKKVDNSSVEETERIGIRAELRIAPKTEMEIG